MNDVVTIIASQRTLTPMLREKFAATYGNRGIKALAALDGQRVKKYLDFFIVEGATAEYILDEDFCTCGDFLFRGRECWHLLAVRLALATGLSIPVGDWYQDRWMEKSAEP